MFKLLPLLLACALVLVLAAGCDYPQAGCYELRARDDRGEVVARFPFAVEELVDDTEMTTGYLVLLPRRGDGAATSVIEVPLANGTDFSRRNWLLGLSAADSGAGDLHMDLTHADEQLAFTGAYRAEPFAPVARVAALLFAGAAVGGAARLEFAGSMPEVAAAPGAVQWELAELSAAEFDKALGTPLKKAKRVAATPCEEAFLQAALTVEQVPLEQAELAPTQDTPETAAAKAKAKPQPRSKQPPTLGGRGGKRPR